MWLSADPAMGEYVPGAPINDEVKKQNQNLPGMGGVYNSINMHVFAYAGNNPVNLTDPDGSIIVPPIFVYRQSDASYAGEDLGGKQTFDDAGDTKRNTIGAFGCFFMAAASVGFSLKHMRDDGTYSTVQSGATDNPLDFNKEGYFHFKTPGSNKGTDVFLNDAGVPVVRDASGKAIKHESGTRSDLWKFQNDSKRYLIIAEVKTNDKGGRHFIVLNSIRHGPYQSTVLDYTEQYDGFKDRKFTSADIVSIHAYSLE
jgi:hypothetical protein